MTAQTITNLGFLSEFGRRHDYMSDRPFCWVLGSGASVQSGIPSGGKLTQVWLTEMYEMENTSELSIEEWATAENLGIPGFEYANAARSYPWIYQRRFQDYKEEGYAFLENIMDKAEPSFGYSVLAQIMASTDHKVAITTNFDNLIADALSIYTRTFPLVCGHESLTGYIRTNMRRPLVAKIHRDLLLAPLSNPDEISSLPDVWGSALTKIFSRFTPIVLGYGGNDGSLMNFLKALDPIEGGIFWCHRMDSAVDPAVSDVVDRHRGRLVPIVGFDEVMLQLQEKLKLQFLLPQLQSVHDKRREDYQKQFEALTASLRKPAESAAAEEARKPVREAADAAVERLTKEKNWWSWQLKADVEADAEKREAIYRAGLEDFPESARLMGNFASFLSDVRKNYDEAEKLYQRTLELDPDLAITTGNYANFMRDVRKNYDEAERLYRRSLELDPNYAVHTGNLANFMWGVRKNHDEAERLYRRSLELDPNISGTLVNFAEFLASRGRTEEAHECLRRVMPGPDSDQVQVEFVFTLWLLDRAASRAGVRALGRLRAIIRAGFLRAIWSFDELLATMLPCLPETERPLAQKLADAILDETKVPALDDEPLWQAATPIPLSVPWSEVVEEPTPPAA
jgi:tetratricopeptide (TPR) repeat protein